MEDGNIFVRFCLYGINIVGLPKVISVSQYNFLVAFNEKIKEIYLHNEYRFNNEPISFVTFDDLGYSMNNIEAILVEAKKRIGDVKDNNEIIVGDSIKDLESYQLLFDVNTSRKIR